MSFEFSYTFNIFSIYSLEIFRFMMMCEKNIFRLFPIDYLYIFVSFLIALSRVSKIILKRMVLDFRAAFLMEFHAL